MAEEAEPEEEAPKKGGKMPLIIGVVLALLGGGGGFFAVQLGVIGGAEKVEAEAEMEDETGLSPAVEVSFVAIDPLVISLPEEGARGHLRFAAQLEVPPQFVAEVEALKPRIVDVLNGYLRALEVAELEDPTALIRLRGQMLRRVQVVVGTGRVNDLLIMEFVLS